MLTKTITIGSRIIEERGCVVWTVAAIEGDSITLELLPADEAKFFEDVKQLCDELEAS